MKKKALLVPAVLLTLACASCSSAGGRGTSGGPEKTPILLTFYRDVISPVDGDRCPMIPSCSAYAAEGVSRHGWFMGWIMACDRLIRCGGDEFDHSEIILQGEEHYCVDPLTDNDFWWSGR